MDLRAELARFNPDPALADWLTGTVQTLLDQAQNRNAETLRLLFFRLVGNLASVHKSRIVFSVSGFNSGNSSFKEAAIAGAREPTVAPSSINRAKLALIFSSPNRLRNTFEAVTFSGLLWLATTLAIHNSPASVVGFSAAFASRFLAAFFSLFLAFSATAGVSVLSIAASACCLSVSVQPVHLYRSTKGRQSPSFLRRAEHGGASGRSVLAKAPGKMGAKWLDAGSVLRTTRTPS